MSPYDKWRQFYADRIIGWMDADQLRECCGRLGTADAPSPELVLFHAMHEIERLKHGMTPEMALTKPVDQRCKRKRLKK